jgi:hypothetical protein
VAVIVPCEAIGGPIPTARLADMFWYVAVINTVPNPWAVTVRCSTRRPRPYSTNPTMRLP